MDRTHVEPIASREHQHGEELQYRSEQTNADLPRASPTGVTLMQQVVAYLP
jgi:hypothetical protein